tara:strand:+ start:4405 stop:4599 length:195 start_codon:yes stop_codon:yes gene_type:complete
MRCAVVNLQTNIVMNVIVADAAVDPAPGGCFLVNTEGSCNIGWVYDDVMNDFVDPNPPEEEEPV